jgi:predicted dehydrogenase
MEEGAEWSKRVNVSYAEAFQEELLHFYDCIVNGAETETDGRDGREDIRVLQQLLAAATPPGLGGEAARR